MTESTRSPAELRSLFGDNLRRLSHRYPSVSEMCRQLGINRTQFNRYLGGESFPRPDVLDRMCRFFGVDARILLKPLDEIEAAAEQPALDTINRFLAAGSDKLLTPGFYHAIETDPGNDTETRHRLFFVRRIGHCALLRGYEPGSLMPGKPARVRELRGIISHTGTQLNALMSRQGGEDRRMMVLSEHRSGTGGEWSGYLVRLTDVAAPGPEVLRLKLRHLAHDLPSALRLGRCAPHAPWAP